MENASVLFARWEEGSTTFQMLERTQIPQCASCRLKSRIEAEYRLLLVGSGLKWPTWLGLYLVKLVSISVWHSLDHVFMMKLTLVDGTYRLASLLVCSSVDTVVL